MRGFLFGVMLTLSIGVAATDARDKLIETMRAHFTRAPLSSLDLRVKSLEDEVGNLIQQVRVLQDQELLRR